jgi:DNA-binding response OmpR family regulator
MIEYNAPLALVVEDDQTIGPMIALMLKLQGYQSIIVPTADKALEQLKTLQPTLITLDLNMPGMSSTDFLTHLRLNPRTKAIPVIVITAHQHVTRDVRAQVQYVMTKPFAMEELVYAISTSLPAPLLEREVGQRLAA